MTYRIYIENLLLRNDLPVNIPKTECILNTDYFTICVIDGEFILPYNSVRNHGVIMDIHLSFGHHMNATYKSANYHLRRIAYIRKYFSTRITRKLINDLVLSMIDYCGSLFSDINSADIKKVYRIIRAYMRLIYNVNR